MFERWTVANLQRVASLFAGEIPCSVATRCEGWEQSLLSTLSLLGNFTNTA